MKKPRRCPECGGTEVVPIAYGMPAPELIESAERGEVVLGGCVIGDADPRWHCKECDHSWRDPDED